MREILLLSLDTYQAHFARSVLPRFCSVHVLAFIFFDAIALCAIVLKST
jgi:hypothetical protein